LEKNLENINSDVKLPDINKNQRFLGNNNRHLMNRDKTEINEINNIHIDKDVDNINNNLIHSHKKKVSIKDFSEEHNNKDFNINNLNDEKNLNEKKTVHKYKKKSKIEEIKNDDFNIETNFQNQEDENDNNINELSNIMKKLLSEEHQII